LRYGVHINVTIINFNQIWYVAKTKDKFFGDVTGSDLSERA